MTAIGRWLLKGIAISLSAMAIAVPALAIEDVEASIDRSRQFYEGGDRWEIWEAVETLEQLATNLADRGDFLGEAIAYSNLSLVYRRLGEWQASETAIDRSIEKLQALDSPETLAKAWQIRGQLQLETGQFQEAIDGWDRAASIYAELGNDTEEIRSQVARSQALQGLGLYRRSLVDLEAIVEALESSSNAELKAIALLELGNVLRAVGRLEESRSRLQESFTLATETPLEAEVAMSSGNTAFAIAKRAEELGDRPTYRSELERADDFYKQAIRTKKSGLVWAQGNINIVGVGIEMGDYSGSWSLAFEIQRQFLSDRSMMFSRLDRRYLNAQINLARTLIDIARLDDRFASELDSTGRLLDNVADDARAMGDRRTESYALGTLGELYEFQQQWSAAQHKTERALRLAAAANAEDIAYRWHWQLGRVLKQQGKKEDAIAAYKQSVETLKTLRGDLVAVSTDLQFSFRDSVEPVYRQFVKLLLEENPTQAQLETARATIEGLQLAELDNFFREACVEANPVQIDRIDPKAAVIYAIVIDDRVEVIASRPGQPLRHYGHPLSPSAVEDTLDNLEQNTRASIALERTDDTATNQTFSLTPFQQVYDWLLRPLADDLEDMETLVFVLDGPLRGIPVAALHDGDRYLIETHAVALTPGLQLLPSRSRSISDFETLAAGLSQMPDRFSSRFADLPGVRAELAELAAEVEGEFLLDDNFTSENLQRQLAAVPYPVVHLATHGQFGSTTDETFVLSWDERINIDRLRQLLLSRDPNARNAIELLVLSACQTAVGDPRAALGLAGVAVRSGARSTVASLWAVDDEATALLMSQFYRELSENPDIGKAQALRNAQLTLLRGNFQRPAYWAAFTIVGNWQ